MRGQVAKVLTVVLDFDGTIKPHDGMVSQRIKVALKQLRTAGIKLILVTGRCLPELEELADTSAFDMIVAENGAVLFNKGRKTLLVPSGWNQERARLSKLSNEGREEVIIALDRSQEDRVLAAVNPALETVEFNKDRLMVLPAGVSKLSGLLEALKRLGTSTEETMVVGDGENDLAMFKAARVKVALQNAVDSLKRAADYVTLEEDGEGVIEAIKRFVSGDPSGVRPR
jgi:phosphoglycolate phosphatase (TIGR01487 family)